jgi:hypothetical protein
MNDETRQLATAARSDVAALPGFHSAAAFELLQRESRVFTGSSMVPAPFRQWNADREGQVNENNEALPNCMIALNIALRMRADPLMVMQNLYIVHGYPSWSTKFLIALFNTCGRFTAIRYAMSEDKRACTAYCTELATGERIEGPTVSIDMAKAEGWFDKKGSKWRTMPEVMLRNRAAAFLIRLTAPDLSLGLPTRDEADDMTIDMEPPARPPSTLQTVRDILRDAPAPTAPADVIDPEPEPVPESPTPEPAPAKPEPEAVYVEPKNLPLKDGERGPDDAQRIGKPIAHKDNLPAFNVSAYARRIQAVKDLDLLTLMREEIGTLPPSSEREELMALLDAKTHSLIDEGN